MCRKLKSLNSRSSCRHCDAKKIVIVVGLQLRKKITAIKMQKSSGTTKTSTCTSILDLTTQSSLVQIAKNLTVFFGKKNLQQDSCVLIYKISKKRKINTHLNPLTEEETQVVVLELQTLKKDSFPSYVTFQSSALLCSFYSWVREKSSSSHGSAHSLPPSEAVSSELELSLE